MRLQILSDLHNEFLAVDGEPVPDVPATGADLLILAGDVDHGVEAVHWAARQAERLGVPVLLVPGNHEYYHGVFPDTLEAMRRAASGTGVSVLDCDEWRHPAGGLRVLGTTLWTDYGASVEEDAGECMRQAEMAMADYRFIGLPDGGPLTALRLLERFRESARWLRQQLDSPWEGHTVVVSHTAPSPRCAHPHYGLDTLSACFVVDMEALIDPRRVQLWVHGHTHANTDLVINGVRVVSNQRGYPGELLPEGPAFAMNRVVTVG